MGIIGALALATDAACFAVLWRRRGDDINMRSVWLCSRNDIVANTAVLAAASGVWVTSSRWPDVIVGAGICWLFLSSGIGVAREAVRELRRGG